MLIANLQVADRRLVFVFLILDHTADQTIARTVGPRGAMSGVAAQDGPTDLITTASAGIQVGVTVPTVTPATDSCSLHSCCSLHCVSCFLKVRAVVVIKNDIYSPESFYRSL
jgi:hypothetical protein